MPIIRLHDVVKEFRVPKQHGGRFGTMRTLFTHQHTVTRAVSSISLSVTEGEVVGYVVLMAQGNLLRSKCSPAF